jgi:hypothetical protein
VGVFIEEVDKEHASNNGWDKEDTGNEDEPPVDSITKDEVEDFNETWKDE